MTKKQKKEEIRIACLKCDTDTLHDIQEAVAGHESGDWGIYWWNYQIIKCRGCESLSFRKESGTDDIIGEHNGELIYDSNEEIFPSRVTGRKQLTHYFVLPSNVQQIYLETYQAVCSKQPILAGMGIRAIVEAVCAEKNAKGKYLWQRIDDLVNVGVLTKEGAAILHLTRNFGNDATHEMLQIKLGDLNVLMDLAENLLSNTYILPDRAERLKKRKNTSKASKTNSPLKEW